MKTNLLEIVAKELNLKIKQTERVVQLLSEGNTIPFIARYRKEISGNLDEVQIRDIRDRMNYLTELEERKLFILNALTEQNKLTDILSEKIKSTSTKQKLEDIYLPFRPKRRTRAMIARENGLEPLAELICYQMNPEEQIKDFLRNNQDLSEEKSLQGARDIIAEWVAEDADLKEMIRNLCWSQGKIQSLVSKKHQEEKTKFQIYYEYIEAINKIPAHRYLAIRRGEEESILNLRMQFPEDHILEIIKKKWIPRAQQTSLDLSLAIEDSFNRLISPSIEVDLRMQLKTNADADSIKIFGENLKNLLFAPLGGARTVMGLDPGFASGTKWVIIDPTGKFISKGVIYPTQPRNNIEGSEKELLKAFKTTPFENICIGNGTASREVMQFVRGFIKKHQLTTVKPVIVSESGASVYSASDIAREEFPDMDLTFRGAVSIARRFQDALSELVKIDPKSIGVGQYQHDVNQKRLQNSLSEVVESCVNRVGVNLNTASVPLLTYVSGLSRKLAINIVKFRDQHGKFKNRLELSKVDQLGPRSFEQAAGFLRICDGDSPLDESGVHPENYSLVDKMALDYRVPIKQMIRNSSLLDSIKVENYVTDSIGTLTIKDIIKELKKPGRDPREKFVEAKLDDSITEIKDLCEGMQLEGTITNITKFGAFVDLGVHQDGLVHVSEISDHFIENPMEICKVGEIVSVRVLGVDQDRKRISLTMRKQQLKKQKTQKKMTGVSLSLLAEKFGSI